MLAIVEEALKYKPFFSGADKPCISYNCGSSQGSLDWELLPSHLRNPVKLGLSLATGSQPA
jgi:hypothetical protein